MRVCGGFFFFFFFFSSSFFCIVVVVVVVKELLIVCYIHNCIYLDRRDIKINICLTSPEKNVDTRKKSLFEKFLMSKHNISFFYGKRGNLSIFLFEEFTSLKLFSEKFLYI